MIVKPLLHDLKMFFFFFFNRKLFRQVPRIGLRGTCGGCLKLG